MVAAVVAFVCALAWPSVAAAFHAGNVYDKSPGAGGGGGIFYAGTAREKGWNCTACHRDIAGTIKVTLASDPPQLLQAFRYEPGKTYALEAKLEGEHLGAGPSNFNGLTVVIAGANGAPAGEITGYAADELYSGGPTTARRSGTNPPSAGQRPGGSRRWRHHRHRRRDRPQHHLRPLPPQRRAEVRDDRRERHVQPADRGDIQARSEVSGHRHVDR